MRKWSGGRPRPPTADIWCRRLRVFRRLREGSPVRMLDLRWRKPHRVRVAVLRQPLDHRATGLSQAKQLRYFVEGFTGSVVASVADVLVRPALALLLREI